jgi:predicted transposase YdaD
MEYVTSVERIGIEKGRQEGKQELVVSLLNYPFGALGDTLIQRIHELSLLELESLAKALLDFTSISDLHNWPE